MEKTYVSTLPHSRMRPFSTGYTAGYQPAREKTATLPQTPRLQNVRNQTLVHLQRSPSLVERSHRQANMLAKSSYRHNSDWQEFRTKFDLADSNLGDISKNSATSFTCHHVWFKMQRTILKNYKMLRRSEQSFAAVRETRECIRGSLSATQKAPRWTLSWPELRKELQ